MTQTDADMRTLMREWMEKKEGGPVIRAATVVLLRDHSDGLQVLMMRKNSKMAFGGMWVFPGGKVDESDYDPNAPKDVFAASRQAAIREAEEEAGIHLETHELQPFSHWTPPVETPKRFATWFFIADFAEGDVTIDNSEIIDSQWLSVEDIFARQANKEIELAPPTWMTLNELKPCQTVQEAFKLAQSRPPRFYLTQVGELNGDHVLMWEGDDGYIPSDAKINGKKHRLTLARGSWVFEYTL